MADNRLRELERAYAQNPEDHERLRELVQEQIRLGRPYLSEGSPGQRLLQKKLDDFEREALEAGSYFGPKEWKWQKNCERLSDIIKSIGSIVGPSTINTSDDNLERLFSLDNQIRKSAVTDLGINVGFAELMPRFIDGVRDNDIGESLLSLLQTLAGTRLPKIVVKYFDLTGHYSDWRGNLDPSVEEILVKTITVSKPIIVELMEHSRPKVREFACKTIRQFEFQEDVFDKLCLALDDAGRGRVREEAAAALQSFRMKAFSPLALALRSVKHSFLNGNLTALLPEPTEEEIRQLIECLADSCPLRREAAIWALKGCVDQCSIRLARQITQEILISYYDQSENVRNAANDLLRKLNFLHGR